MNKIKIVATVIFCLTLLWITTRYVKPSSALAKVPNPKYIILAYNDLGMHCIQKDYSGFLILPPGNNLRVQVFKTGVQKAELITEDIIVEYEVNGNTTSANKLNFWKYAKDYGYDIPEDVGITGNRLKGVCVLSSDKKYFEATAIPITPFNDNDTKENPYQTTKVSVKDAVSGQVLAVQDKVVLPVSVEMNCSNCHGTVETNKNILSSHDQKEGTKLYSDFLQNKLHRCSECHKDNALEAPGKPGVPSLSYSVHNSHSARVASSSQGNGCYNCHPGPVTQCSRGVMAANGLTCASKGCHGSMEQVAQSQKYGREAWVNEPDCGDCHGKEYGSNILNDSGAKLLYHNSYLMNGPNGMNGIIHCASCHNSPHSEWPSTVDVDNSIPLKILGKRDFIRECTACHQGSGKIHGKTGGNQR
jgi:hypothetical protein